MKITARFRDRLVGAGAGVAALMLLTFVPNVRGQATPRQADGHPDLTGRYQYASGGAQPNPDFKPATKSKYLTPMPKDVCAAGGTPTSITYQGMSHGVIQLISKPGNMWVLTEMPQSVRWIPTDGRPHTKDPDISFAGESYGRWEGDTLVVDTVEVDHRMRNIFSASNAWTHTEDEHVVEHFNRPSKDSLTYQVTIEDPMVLAKPYTSAQMKFSLVEGAGEKWKVKVPIPGCDF